MVSEREVSYRNSNEKALVVPLVNKLLGGLVARPWLKNCSMVIYISDVFIYAKI